MELGLIDNTADNKLKNIIGIRDISGNIMKNVKKLTNIDIFQACTKEQEYVFLLDSSSIDILDDIRYESNDSKSKSNSNFNLNSDFKCDDFINNNKLIKVKAKFFFDNKDKTSELLSKFNAGLYDNLSKDKMRLSLGFSGNLDLICQRCAGKMSMSIDNKFDNNYILASFSGDKNKYSDNNYLDKNDLMEIFCLKSRLDLIELAKQEVALCIDMFPKHEDCFV